MLSLGWVVRKGRCDTGKVEAGKEFIDAMSKLIIEVIPTPKEKPEPNVERVKQMVNKDIATILSTSPTLSVSDWLYCAHFSSQMRDMVTNARSRQIDPSKSPYEILRKRAPRVNRLLDVTIGDIVTFKTPKKREIMH
jgi:hypothetical protein